METPPKNPLNDARNQDIEEGTPARCQVARDQQYSDSTRPLSRPRTVSSLPIILVRNRKRICRQPVVDPAIPRSTSTEERTRMCHQQIISPVYFNVCPSAHSEYQRGTFCLKALGSIPWKEDRYGIASSVVAMSWYVAPVASRKPVCSG